MPPSQSAKELLESLIRERERSGSKPSDDPSDLVEMLLTRPSLTNDEMVERLRRAHEQWNQKHDFKSGQVVKWKKGLRNKKSPRDGEPAIVMEVLPEPVCDESNDAGTPYFRENLDVILGVLDGQGDLVSFHFDSRRFEPWAPSPGEGSGFNR
jgi:hypothetical protein